MAKKNLYDEYSIVTETPRAFTRRVPSTYLGSSRTNTNLIKEIFANAVDEHAIGHGDKISITVDTAKNIYTIEDNGQGFLVNAGIDDDGETILQRSFDKLNTSGKTSADGVYEGTALGLNGIGAKLTNWLSKKLIVTTYREGEFEELTFIDGIFKNRKVGKAKRESGTIVTWSPDPQFFQANEPDIAMLKSHFEIIAALCPKLTIVLNYNGKESIYQEQGGLNSYVDCKVKGKEIFSNRFVTERNIDVTYYKPKEYPGLVLKDGDFNKNNEYIYDRSYDVRVGDEGSSVSPKHTVDTIKKSDCTTDVRQEKISICMTYTSDYSENIDAYVNLGHTDAGAHIQAFHTAFVRAINKYATDAGWLKKNDKNFNINEISEGLYVIFNMTTTTARYDAQNKSRIDDIDARSINAVIGGDFATWLMNSPSDAKIIVDRAMTARRAREAAQKAKEKIRDASNGKGAKSIFADLPTKLSDAYPKNKKDRSRCELYICLKGDTKIKLLNGTNPTIESLVGQTGLWAYSTNENGAMIPAQIKRVFKTQDVTKMIKITFENNSVVECTPEHKFLDRDTCTWVEAKNLHIGQSMFSMKFSKDSQGHDLVYIPGGKGNYITRYKDIDRHYYKGIWEPVHLRTALYLGIAHEFDGTYMDIHHKDLNKQNNDPSNFDYIIKKDHLALHNKINYESGRMDYSNKHFTEESLHNMQHAVYNRSEEGINRQRKAVSQAWKDGKYTNATWTSYNKDIRFKNGVDQTQVNKVSKIIKEMLDKNIEITEESYTSYAKANRKYPISLNKALSWFGSLDNMIESGKNYNLKIVNIEYVEYDSAIPVYCLDIDNPFHSFVLDNGIITHNCEGDSAASSINAVKNSEFQATFPIRGKVLNCQKASTAQVYGNAEIAGITKALGLDIDKTTGKLVYDTKKLRYDKIVIASDEDVDGLDIASLLLTVFNWICPELIEHGHIYHVHGALFKVIYSDKSYELFQTEAELEAWKKKNKKSYILTRAKGLGELTKDETKDQLVNPATRNLHQLIATDMNLFNEYLEMTKGPDSGPRKDYLEEHFNDYEE